MSKQTTTRMLRRLVMIVGTGTGTLLAACGGRTDTGEVTDQPNYEPTGQGGNAGSSIVSGGSGTASGNNTAGQPGKQGPAGAAGTVNVAGAAGVGGATTVGAGGAAGTGGTGGSVGIAGQGGASGEGGSAGQAGQSVISPELMQTCYSVQQTPGEPSCLAMTDPKLDTLLDLAFCGIVEGPVASGDPATGDTVCCYGVNLCVGGRPLILDTVRVARLVARFDWC
jgi:hypothetical protein